jgi:hypothetical protein
VSDLVVARTTFIQGGLSNAAVGLPLYYAALILFALSTLDVSRERRPNGSGVVEFGSEENVRETGSL